MKKMRVKQAADYLNVTPQTIRNWTNDGSLAHGYNGAGQRIFTQEDLDSYKRNRLGLPPLEEPKPATIFYTRTSNKQDVSLENQQQKLTQAYGQPDYVFADMCSGLNDKRRGLSQLISHLKDSDLPAKIYVTNKDRLARFGYNYLVELFHAYNATIIVLDSDETKEPPEILIQDFMSLLASFSGKFYRMRGWEQRKKFLNDVQKEVSKHA